MSHIYIEYSQHILFPFLDLQHLINFRTIKLWKHTVKQVASPPWFANCSLNPASLGQSSSDKNLPRTFYKTTVPNQAIWKATRVKLFLCILFVRPKAHQISTNGLWNPDSHKVIHSSS